MPTRSKYEILVVDDDPSVRETVAMLLMSAGYEGVRKMVSQLSCS